MTPSERVAAILSEGGTLVNPRSYYNDNDPVKHPSHF